MTVTKDGALWTFDMGEQDALGHNDRNNRLVLTRVEAQHFGNANGVSTAGTYFHSAVVTAGHFLRGAQETNHQV